MEPTSRSHILSIPHTGSPPLTHGRRRHARPLPHGRRRRSSSRPASHLDGPRPRGRPRRLDVAVGRRHGRRRRPATPPLDPPSPAGAGHGDHHAYKYKSPHAPMRSSETGSSPSSPVSARTLHRPDPLDVVVQIRTMSTASVEERLCHHSSGIWQGGRRSVKFRNCYPLSQFLLVVVSINNYLMSSHR